MANTLQSKQSTNQSKVCEDITRRSRHRSKVEIRNALERDYLATIDRAVGLRMALDAIDKEIKEESPQ